MSSTPLHPAPPVPGTRDISWSPSHGHQGGGWGQKSPVPTSLPQATVPHIPETLRAICAPPPWESLHTTTTPATSMPACCPLTPEYPLYLSKPPPWGPPHLPVPSLSMPPPACARPGATLWAAVMQSRDLAPKHRTAQGLWG